MFQTRADECKKCQSTESWSDTAVLTNQVRSQCVGSVAEEVGVCFVLINESLTDR